MQVLKSWNSPIGVLGCNIAPALALPVIEEPNGYHPNFKGKHRTNNTKAGLGVIHNPRKLQRPANFKGIRLSKTVRFSRRKTDPFLSKGSTSYPKKAGVWSRGRPKQSDWLYSQIQA